MNLFLSSLLLLMTILTTSMTMAGGTGSVRTFQSTLRFEEVGSEFLHSISVDGAPRITTFHPEKKESSIGVAWQKIQLGDGARALTFDVYGGTGEVLLMGGGELELASKAMEPSALADGIRGEKFGRILHRTSGPHSVENPNQVRWDLRSARSEEVTLVFLDDEEGDWGFIETGSIHLISDHAVGDRLDNQDRLPAHHIRSVGDSAETILMPGGSDWGYLGAAFFKRRLFRGRLPFLTTYLPEVQTRSTGATWLPIRIASDSVEISFQVRGGRGRVLLLRGCHDFSRHANVGSLSREVAFDLSEAVVESTTGREQPETFQKITWTVDKKSGAWLTLLVLDELEGEWGYVDVSRIRVIPN